MFYAIGASTAATETLATAGRGFDMTLLPFVFVVMHDEVLTFAENHRLYSLGIGHSDAHLLGSAMLTPHTELWGRDRRLHEAAIKLALAYSPA